MDVNTMKAAALAVISVVSAFFTWMKVYQGFRSQNVKLSAQRTKRFFKMVADQTWRKVSPAALQMAFSDAFGYELDDRSIRFALGRHRSLALFRDLKRCAGMARISDDGLHFVRWRGLKHPRLSYRTHSIVAFFAGFVPYVLFMMLSPYVISYFTRSTLVFSFIAMVAWCFMTLFLANGFESAHRVVEVLNDLYPPCEGNRATSEDGPNLQPVSPRKMTARRTKSNEEPPAEMLA